MGITALIIAREGSSYKDKNLVDLAGWPLVTWTARAAAASEFVDRKFISSDSDKILNSVESFGYEPIKRPKFLATDTAQGCDVIQHALEEMKREHNHVPDYVLLQHANSPTILTSWIDQCFEILKANPSSTAVVPVVVEMDKHPFRQKLFSEDGSLKSFFPDRTDFSSNRQDLPRSVVLAHNFWLIRTSGGLLPHGEAPWVCLGGRVLGFEVQSAFDIHSPDDLPTAEEWLRTNQTDVWGP